MGLARITNKYWGIECTLKPLFVNLLGLARITDIYWALECISKP